MSPDTPQSRQHILLTGAAGLIGSQVLARLLRRGKPVVALVRPKRGMTPQQRIENVLKRFEVAWECKLPRPIVIDGDLRQSGLGLSAEDFQSLRLCCNSVVHVAASLSFRPAKDSKDHEPYLTNVEGTRHLLEVCKSAEISEFHYTSTAYVCGDREGTVLETDLQGGQSFANDYEQSKVQAEQLLHRSFRGKQLTIYRPSIVIDSEHLSPPSADRTLYVAFSLYQAMQSRMGVSDDVRWFEFLGMSGDERKNIVEASWVADVIDQAINTPSAHGRTYHLTAAKPSTIDQVEAGFRQALENTPPAGTAAADEDDVISEEWLNAIAGPYIDAFAAYFRSDPEFDQTAVDDLARSVKLSIPPTIDAARIAHWAKGQMEQEASEKASRSSAASPRRPAVETGANQIEETIQPGDDPIVIVGADVRLPGAEGGLDAFADLLFGGRSAVTPLPPERLNKQHYYDARRGVVGATYTTLGSCVREDAFGEWRDPIDRLGDFDLAHRHFAEVAAGCFRSFGGDQDSALAHRCGVFVGHSGGTQRGGPTTLGTLAETVTTRLLAGEAFENFSESERKQWGRQWTDAIRSEHSRNPGDANRFNAYSAASLTARLLGLGGPRVVVDAACASSLLALQHAILAIRSGRIDSAIVGGATFNHVDNLILFSQSQACSDTGSAPFDESASGLVSSEGYVAIAVTRKSFAIKRGLPIQAVIRGIGVASDGRGKSLWAPRSEGQQLAMRRGYDSLDLLDVDYQEAHATSTQIGDATELTSLASLLKHHPQRTKNLKIGSVKSNFGHTLEAAGLVGLVKVLLAMKHGQVPPTINVRNRTSFFDWSTAPLEVVTQTQDWPRGDRPRRAAVNAFGIGGLNAHLVVEQFEKPVKHAAKLKPVDSKTTLEPIAIVARGVVLAGANNVSEFSELLRSDRTAIAPPPQDRWRGEVAVGSGGDRGEARTPTNRGGYIDRFRFNGQPYRIPPKQVSLANPVQMMLIDAVNQAAMELDGAKWDIDRTRAGVVVGTIFGGEFANELLVGLKAPEILSHLRELVGSNSVDASELIARCREDLLKAYPAILDETGSFTASTLASRIVKTFDLMGGACAVDSDEAASGTALMLAVDQLNQGKLDFAICGAAERALDIVAFERIDQKGRLVRSGRIEEIARDGSKILPGEGVAVVMLQRLSDARRQGRKIYGLIDQVECGVSDDPNRLRSQQFSSDPVHHQVFSRIGSLFGAHTLVQTIAKTCLAVDKKSVIASTAEDGFYVNVHLSLADMPKEKPAAATRLAIIRLQAKTEDEFSKLLESARTSPDQLSECQTFSSEAIYRAAVMGRTRAELDRGIQVIAEAFAKGDRVKSFPRERAMLFKSQPGRDRIGWAFPGQGSQYAAVPDVIREDRAAADAMAQFDAILNRLGHRSISPRLSDPDHRLGIDLWWTQAWVLAVSSVLSQTLRRTGHRPDVVLGHSFGECGAALDAGVLTVEQAIRFAKLRSDAVAMTVAEPGQLFSVRADPSEVRGILNVHEVGCTVTHHNSPEQTVIAGSKAQIQHAKEVLGKSGYAGVVIPVPAAFHTPQMIAAEQILDAGFDTHGLRPPRCAFLSATSMSYVAEPNAIRAALVGQLSRPVLYASSVRRMVDDGCSLIIEVGPSDVLTRLNLATVGGDALCIALDSKHHSHQDRLRFIDLAVECACGTKRFADDQFSDESHLTSTASEPSSAPEPHESVEVIDLTKRGRRASQRTAPEIAIQPSPSLLVNETATEAIQAVTPSTTSLDQESVKQFLIDLIVELTGYQPDVIDCDADLEAELGVDSIKKAQVIGELAEWADIKLDLREMRLADFNSLTDIMALAKPPGVKSSNDDARRSADSPNSKRHSAPEPASPSISENLSDSIERLMIDFVVDQTGYAPEVVDLDADLEAELGVDSIKKAQLLGELAEHYDLRNVELGRTALGDFSNLRSIRDFVVHHLVDNPRENVDQVGQTAALPRTSKNASSLHALSGRVERQRTEDLGLPLLQEKSEENLHDLDSGTGRYVMEVVDRPRRVGTPTVPTFFGDALIIGDNAVSEALDDRLIQLGVKTHRISSTTSTEDVETELEKVWKHTETPHLFITTPHDESALRSLSPEVWSKRKGTALNTVFRACQLWMTRMIAKNMMDRASLVSVTHAGGGLGFDQVSASPESGAVAGLTKAMLIEAWMRGFRETPMKVIEPIRGATAVEAVDGILRELAVPTHDQEAIVGGEKRRILRARYRPLDSGANHQPQVTEGGVWIVSGGGRGITALTALALAERSQLKLVLLGTAPHPNQSLPDGCHDELHHGQLRQQVMHAARDAGDNPIKAWRDCEKAMEIAQTLAQCESKGIQTQYISADVSDAGVVEKVLQEVRRNWGPIRGVIHGAGAGQDARFDRKRPDKVEQCIGAKVDGCIALAAATEQDPLEWFIGFGSISGRFGANGHTDYSLANDMLAKCIGRLSTDRPNVRCVTFHWHAWGDIGMAAKPETKLALEMIGMQFMPSADGLKHFLDELAYGGNSSEVLITDAAHVRKFLPEIPPHDAKHPIYPMLNPKHRHELDPQSNNHVITLDASKPFLRQHRVGDRPTLPFVMALEMMAEAASLRANHHPIISCFNVQAFHPIKLDDDTAMAIEIVKEAGIDSENSWSIRADLRRADGRLVEEGRKHFQASFRTAPTSKISKYPIHKMSLPLHRSWTFDPIEYVPIGAPVYHGDAFQMLREIAIDGDEALGHIIAPSPIQVAGADFPLAGWIIPCAAMDAVLYAAALLAHRSTGKLGLPVSFDEIHVGRLPDPGEPLTTLIRKTAIDDTGMTFAAHLVGQNGDCLLEISNYQIRWLVGNALSDRSNSQATKVTR